MKPTSCYTRIIVLSAIVISVARSQPTTHAASNTEEDVVNLSPFSVTPDNSWAATTTLSGNRTKQDIEKVPASVNVITSEFMKDLDLGSLEDAAAYVPG